MSRNPMHEDQLDAYDRQDRYARLTPYSLFLVILIAWVAFEVQLVVMLGVLALLFGTILEGPVQRLEQRKFPRPAAIATVYLALIGGLGLLLFLLVNPISDQADEFRSEAPAQFRELEEDWRNSSNPILNGFGADMLSRGIAIIEDPGGAVDGSDASEALPVLISVGTGIVSAFTLLVITFYYLLEKSLIRRVVLEQIHPERRDRVNEVWSNVERKVGGWMRGQLLLCLIIGSIATVAYGIVGLRFWPLLGLWAGLTEIIPIVGPWLGGIPAVLIALTMGWEVALVTAIIIFGMQMLENTILVPRVMKGAVGLTPLTVFVAILAGTQLLGIIGAILAIPVAATVQVILSDVFARRRGWQSQSLMSGWRWMISRSPLRDDDEPAPEEPEEFVSYEEQVEGDSLQLHPEPEPAAQFPARTTAGSSRKSGWGFLASDRPKPDSDNT